MTGGPGMPLGAMAQVKPYFFNVGQVSGPQISTDLHPRALALAQVLSMSHFSPAILKHQNTTEWLIFPLSGFSAACTSWVPKAAAPSATDDCKSSRRDIDIGIPERPVWRVVRISRKTCRRETGSLP